VNGEKGRTQIKLRAKGRRLVGAMTGLAVLVSVTGGTALYLSNRGAAAQSVKIAPFASMSLTPSVRAIVDLAARHANVDPASLVSVSPVGAGTRQRTALVGSDRSGHAHMSFFNGFGMTSFSPVDPLLNGTPIYVNVSSTGPTTDVREVGLVGVARRDVARVSVSHADGSAEDVTLTTRGNYSFFAVLTDNASLFPTSIRAYGGDGSLLSDDRVNTRPLCPPEAAQCLN
jgi:hypothetical protein